MKVVDWVRCDDRSTAKRVCNRLVAIGARIINVAVDGEGDGTVVWFEHEGDVDTDALLKGDET